MSRPKRMELAELVLALAARPRFAGLTPRTRSWEDNRGCTRSVIASLLKTTRAREAHSHAH